MTLSQRQAIFTQNLAILILKIPELVSGGAGVLGEVMRSKAQAAENAKTGAGIANSLHLDCLAGDVKLFIHGVWQTKSEAYKPLGTFWKSLHVDNRWGGDFKSRPDGNHFSMTDDGHRA